MKNENEMKQAIKYQLKGLNKEVLNALKGKYYNEAYIYEKIERILKYLRELNNIRIQKLANS